MRRTMWQSIAIGVTLAAAGVAISPNSSYAGDNDDELAARIQTENNPVKKAKFEIRLGRMKLSHAVEACEKDDHTHCQEFLGSFLSLMKGSWNRLEATGRVAAKHVDGFKELDIALREGSRQLEDLKHRVPVEDMGQIDSAQKETEQLRVEVLRALFPALEQPEGTIPPRKRGHPASAAGASP